MIRVKNNEIDRFSLIAVGFLIAVTANPFFYETVHPILFGTLFYGFIFLKKGKKISPQFHFAILFITLIFLGQYFTVGNLSIVTYFGVLMRFFLAYFVLNLIKQDFFIITSSFVTKMAYLSLLIYIPLTIFPFLVDFLISNVSPYVQAPFIDEFRAHIVLFDLSSMHIKRFGNFGLNSGFYWEPGAHAIFLIYALAINLFVKNKIFNKNNLILIFTILTTFSTTGYVSLAILLLFFLITIKTKKARFKAYFFLLPILSIIIYNSFSNLTFLSSKIEQDIEYMSSSNNVGSRFQSFLFDFNSWKEYPLFGKDRSTDSQGRALEFTRALHRNNGLGILLATYGIFSFLIYLYLAYKGIRMFQNRNNLSKRFSQVFMILFLLTSFGMPMTLRPYYYALVLLPIVYKKQETFKRTII